MTCTFAILEVAPTTFSDIKARLRKTGTLAEYLQKDDDYGWLIVFDGTALAVKKRKKRNQ